MKLRKLELHGFKSFADRTDFVFEDGLTAIVGPNGCGKSNLVDAIRWVLGEQSAKSLRGIQMMDVIFKGSATRKGQGLAQITLTFDNTDRTLLFDADAVAVTRKLYRSGESEYLINNNDCRLRDVRELFLDTGLGHDSYSIIKQGKVALLVQSSSIERRAVFDEASGIAKYKARCKEATRKLERTEQSLLRITDIIEEVHRQLRSVKLQAGKARNFQQHDHRLRQLRISGALAEFDQLVRQRSNTAQARSKIEDQNAQLSSELSQISAQNVRFGMEVADFDRQITAADNLLVQNRANISSARDHIQFARTRAEESKENLDHQRHRGRQLKALTAQLKARLASQEILVQKYRSQEDELQYDLDQLQQEHAHAGQETALQAADLEDQKSGVVDLVRHTSQLHNEISGQDRFRQTLGAQRDRISNEATALESRLKELLIRKAQLEAKASEITTLLDQEQQAWEQGKEQARQAQLELPQLQEQLTQAKEARSAIKSRQSLLEDMEARLDGIHQGVKQILQTKSPQRFDYVVGMIADLFETDVDNAGLIEAALAGAEQFLVATDSRKLTDELGQMGKLPGRVNLLCLDLIPPWVNGYDWAQHEQYLGRAVDYVKFDPELAPVAWHLLGRTIVVKDLTAAMDLSRQGPSGYRYVTAKGQLLEPDGLLRLGPTTGTSGLMLRHSQLRQLSERMPRIEAQIIELSDRLNNSQAQLNHLQQTQQKLRTAIYEANVLQAQNSSQIQQNAEAINQLSKDKPRLATEINQLEAEIAKTLTVQDDSRSQLAGLEELSQKRNEKIADLTAQHRQALQVQQALAEKVADLRVALTKAHEQFSAAKSELSNIQHTLVQNDSQGSSISQDIQAARKRITDTEHTILKTEARLAQLFADRQLIQKECAQCHNRRDLLAQDIESGNQNHRQLSQKQEQIVETLHQNQIKLSEIAVRIETLTQRIQEDFNLSLEQEYENYEPTELDLQEVAREVEELRGKIQRLGNVNLDAITQQEELEVRSAFLQGQHDDIAKSKEQLEELIRRINLESRELFLSSFAEIRERFGEFFRKLFGGGRADVLLSDPDDPLECGIEIIARPPGKELQSITLLSGGEKTLAAVALLFAIFRSKTSPLCILDEVDAALDEANNDRFNALLQEFLLDSQFIVITHSKRTMTIADVLYGVTMQEPGVSKQVSVKFDNQSVAVA